jgi:chemotaxis regulatin CheY-phosphate phosphatase CheZ
MTTPVPTETKMMKDLLQLLRETVPLLESVRNSIQDSSSRIPKASEQLSKVTHATETAAVEILDVIEKMSERMSKGEKRLAEVRKSIEDARQAADGALAHLIAAGAGRESAPKIEAAFQQLHAFIQNQTLTNTLQEAGAIFAETSQDSMTIAIALQVQDITNQQIVGVSDSIDCVYRQLADALQRFDKGVMDPDIPAVPGRVAIVDVNAEYTKSPERQSAADEIFSAWNQTQP